MHTILLSTLAYASLPEAATQHVSTLPADTRCAIARQLAWHSALAVGYLSDDSVIDGKVRFLARLDDRRQLVLPSESCDAVRASLGHQVVAVEILGAEVPWKAPYLSVDLTAVGIESERLELVWTWPLTSSLYEKGMVSTGGWDAPALRIVMDVEGKRVRTTSAVLDIGTLYNGSEPDRPH